MSIMDRLFGPKETPPPPATTTQQQNSGIQQTPPPATGLDGMAQNLPATGVKELENPLDPYKELWKNDPNSSEGKTDNSIFGNIDADKLKAAAAGVDFNKSLSPELLAKINAGGQEAQQAMLQALNNTAQAVYAQSALATTQIVEKAVAAAEQKFAAKIPGLLKSQNLSDSLIQENPALSHPAAQPIIQAIQQQLTVKYPNATPAELNKHAKDYLANFADIAVVKPPPAKSELEKGETDWSTFGDFQ